MLELGQESGGIVGRDRERRVVARFVERVPSGLVALVVEGDPGIGKSTIWRDGVAQAHGRGCRVLVCQPVAAEARMSFAALGDLLEPVIDDVLGELAAPQRHALEVALLRTDLGDSPRDERAVSVAFLNVIRLLCGKSAVLLAIDDAHWLDRPSARVLEFAIRRVALAPVGVMAALRLDPHARLTIDLQRTVEPERRECLRVGPLSLAALHDLLRARQRMQLSRRMLVKVHQLSGGNPFFALELVDALAARGEPLAPGEPLPVSGTVSELVASRLRRLPARTREALLVASALAQPTIATIDAYDPGWSVGELLDKAERRGLVEVARGRVRFSHPLVSSTVYGEASESARRRIHRRLAEIVSDREQHARHLALAAEEPDEPVAAALEEAADIADARGAPDAAAELCELARDLTPTDVAGTARRRSLAAAGHHFAAGDWEQARSLAEQVIAGGATGPELARALQLLGKVHYYGDSFPEALRLLRGALEHAGDDAAVRAPIELDLAYVSHAFEGFAVAAGHAQAALQHAELLGLPGLLAEALAAAELTEFLSGRGLNRARLERALALEDRTRRVPVSVRPSLIAGMITSWIGEPGEACATLEALRAWLIERGETSELPALGIALVLATCWRGDLDAATRYAQEQFEAAVQAGGASARGLGLSSLATASAYVGNVDDARLQGHESVELLSTAGFHIQTFYPLSALAFLHLSLDQPAETDRLLRPVFSMLDEASLGEPSAAPSLADEIEALIGVGDLSLATSLLDGFQSKAEALDRAVSLATAWRCRGLLLAAQGDHEGAFPAFEHALAQHQRAPRPIELARTLLALGKVQRRANRRRAARGTLERALQTFEELGARQWANRARTELARLGLRRRAASELTPTELQVAEHAGSGMTNRQIAAALFISPKTVEANLARVYRKLGIASRAELGRRLAERERPIATKT